jgi:hypothetical protein
MKNILTVILIGIAFALPVFAQETEIPAIYIDKEGLMRRSDTKAEASFYGVNYTLPFAYAYRAIGYIGKNRKEAIDKDVYHFARLGFNAYRVHVWDVEISDGKGNLIANEHLDLLDYLIAQLQKRNIRIILTAMTNFGNGYPEKNQPVEGFSYLYDKCKIHSDKDAIAAQKNYIIQFINHVNAYTRQAYKDNPYIVGFEINNEPCHSDSPQQTQNYINQMLHAIKQAGNAKPVFYNVSHNMPHVQSYFNTAIQGGTYQWYPIGLVAGHTRKGNFLPYADDYAIPFSNAKGFNKKAKIVYESDPADITCSYMYPAMARTFRSKGFQWITQFAYDPMDLAYSNTEYQTHFLNLVYTPQKALSMKIAAEVTCSVPLYSKYPQYPNDTVFGNFHVSYNQDLSELNEPAKFFYSNHTHSQPVMPDSLKEIAGYGNSPVVQYEGCGAYFLDRLESGLWRLEVMPDAVQVRDPFEKASLKKEVVSILWNTWNMQIRLPDLGKNFSIKAIDKGNTGQSQSLDGSFSVSPGVYLLDCRKHPETKWNVSSAWKNISLGEFAAPESSVKSFTVVHQPAISFEKGKPLCLEAQIIGKNFPDSVLVYTDKVSFWSDKNPYLKMQRINGYAYRTEVPPGMVWGNNFRYGITIYKEDKSYTFPAGAEGSPLDWDYCRAEYWESEAVDAGTPVRLLNTGDEYSNLETYMIPYQGYVLRNLNTQNPAETPKLDFQLKTKNPETRFFWRKYIKEALANREETLKKARYLCLQLNVKGFENLKNLKAGFITSDGFTYMATPNRKENESCFKIPLQDLAQDSTALLPLPYPVFLNNYFVPGVQIPFDIRKIETLEISVSGVSAENAVVSIGNIWLE